jgi:MFS family permease
MRQGPLAGRYPAVAAMVMFALIPYLALSAALNPLTPVITKQLHMSLQTLSLGSGLGNAAYAVGTVLAVQFAQHLPQRRMLVVYAALLVVGSLLTASAQDPGMFIVGHVIQGLCTSLLLIAAIPPLALGYPPDKLRDTAVIMNMCIFGAVALGPFIGGLQAEAHAWRPLFWIVAAISVVALLLALLTFEDAPPANPDSPRDLPAIGLAAVGCVAAFFGASELTSHSFLDVETIVPLLGGLATVVALVIYQYRAKHPLLMVRTMLTSSIPVAGIVVALQPCSHRAALPARSRRRGGQRDCARTGHQEACAALPPVGGHDPARRRDSGLPYRGALQPGTDPRRLGPDRARARRHGRTRAVRRRLLVTFRQPPARLRNCRALPSGSGFHDRSDLRSFRREGWR